jgi:hypothetical protein
MIFASMAWVYGRVDLLVNARVIAYQFRCQARHAAR